jgi:N-methylhydantoinase A
VTYRLGVDVGGTFTDLVLVGPDGAARTCKVLSSAGNYADAIIQGARELLRETGAAAGDIREIIHGTTVATNAILERRGAATGLITTEGFGDLLEIGRLRLAPLYDLNFERPAPLVRRRWRREVRERMNYKGDVLTTLDPASVHAALDRLLEEGVESIAVCLLHAWANGEHERAVGEIVCQRAPGIALTLSSEILPEMREFERTSTAVTNAYVMSWTGISPRSPVSSPRWARRPRCGCSRTAGSWRRRARGAGRHTSSNPARPPASSPPRPSRVGSAVPTPSASTWAAPPRRPR